MEIADKLLKWFEEDSLRERITRVVLLWVNNHFNDFESDMEMTEFLQNFEQALENHVRMVAIGCLSLFILSSHWVQQSVSFILCAHHHKGFVVYQHMKYSLCYY